MAEHEVQTRENDGGLRFFQTLSEAFLYAQKNPEVWKISFNYGEERIRLVRVAENGWKYDPLIQYFER